MEERGQPTRVVESRQALEAILQSGLLLRSQNLQRLLIYICEKAFQGQGDQVKEYTIATEALGRPANFDQKRDSIVRVEVHRLRKRLAQYYEDVGKDDPIRIIIPEGQYVPIFVPRPALPPELENRPTREGVVPPAIRDAPEPGASASLRPVSPPGDPIPPEPESRPAPRWGFPWGVAAAVAGVLLLAAGGGLVWGSRTASEPARKTAPAAPDFAPPLRAADETELRIAAGRSKAFTDPLGRVWLEDRWFEGGWANTSPHPFVRRAIDQNIMATQREGEFTYHIPLEPGAYELRLYFAETVFGEGNPAGGGESTRFFRVEANGAILLDYFDVIADAGGPLITDVKVFRNIEPAADGKLHLAFRSLMHSEPFVNAIEIRRTPPGRIRPIRLVAQSVPVLDALGRLWEPDAYAEGGNMVKRMRPASETDIPEVFRGERFGHFNYIIPVAADGLYKVSLYFHEAWFGPDASGSGGEGSRVFDVFLNHMAVLPTFDLFKSAGARRALVKTFHGVKPNARGKIVLSFEPIRNYACINAIEVEDETPIPARLRSRR